MIPLGKRPLTWQSKGVPQPMSQHDPRPYMAQRSRGEPIPWGWIIGAIILGAVLARWA